MQIETLVVTPFQQNCRVIFAPESGKCAVIDPGGEVERIIALIRRLGAQVESILLTHAHIDHAAGASELESRLREEGQQPLLLAHPAEQAMRSSIESQAAMFGLSGAEYRNVREPDRYLEHGDEYLLGENRAKVLFTPGHAPGHIALFFADTGGAPVLIAGDALFAGSIGRTDLPGGDHETLLRSIREQLYVLPEDTRVLSGHGPETTIGREKQSNPFVRA